MRCHVQERQYSVRVHDNQCTIDQGSFFFRGVSPLVFSVIVRSMLCFNVYELGVRILSIFSHR